MLQDWGLILGAHQLFVRYPSVTTFLAALLLMSWGQRGLSCLTHDSIHRNLVKNRVSTEPIIQRLPRSLLTAR
jgi:hypothetical protein